MTNACTTATATDQYVWGESYVDDLVERDHNPDGYYGSGTPTVRTYAQHDANYNVTSLTDTSGSVVARIAYDPYGNITNSTGLVGVGGSGVEQWLYFHQGGRLDPSTGLYNFRNRDYSTSMGRWVEQDPAGYVDGSNIYLARSANPVGFTDAEGLNDHSKEPIGGPLELRITLEGRLLLGETMIPCPVMNVGKW